MLKVNCLTGGNWHLMKKSIPDMSLPWNLFRDWSSWSKKLQKTLKITIFVMHVKFVFNIVEWFDIYANNCLIKACNLKTSFAT